MMQGMSIEDIVKSGTNIRQKSKEMDENFANPKQQSIIESTRKMASQFENKDKLSAPQTLKIKEALKITKQNNQPRVPSPNKRAKIDEKIVKTAKIVVENYDASQQ